MKKAYFWALTVSTLSLVAAQAASPTHSNTDATGASSIVGKWDCIRDFTPADRVKIEALQNAFEQIAPLRGDALIPSAEYEAKADAILKKQGNLSKREALALITYFQGYCDIAESKIQEKGIIQALKDELSQTPEQIKLSKRLFHSQLYRNPKDPQAWGQVSIQTLNYLRDRALGRMRESHVPRYGLTDAELAIIYGYSGGSLYRIINTALRLRSSYPEYYNEVKPLIDTLSSALNKIPAYKGILNRTTDLPPAVLANYETGNIVSDPAFTSTRMPNAKLQFQGKHFLVIESDNCKPIWGYSMNPDEKEVLCPAGMKFYVDKNIHMETFYLHECPSGNAATCKKE